MKMAFIKHTSKVNSPQRIASNITTNSHTEVNPEIVFEGATNIRKYIKSLLLDVWFLDYTKAKWEPNLSASIILLQQSGPVFQL